MLKIIKTPNGDLLNFAHIIEIKAVEGEGVNAKKETVTMYGITALDVCGKDRDIGIYDTLEEMSEVLGMLEFFLSGSTESLFEMPIGVDGEGEENQNG